MIKFTKYCAPCKEEITKETGCNGFTVKLGYSTRSFGWGFRENFTNPRSMEICDSCFDVVAQKSKELADIIDQLNE